MFNAADKEKINGVAGVLLKDATPKRRKLWFRYPKLLQLNILLLGALVCDITNGFDQSMLNNLYLLDSWQNYFGNPTDSGIAIFTVGTRIGQIAGLPLISPMIRKFGCRLPILFGSSILLVGIALQASATSTAQFVVGRVILGFGNNVQQCGSLILISELAYPDHRPKITAIMNSTGSIGFILGAWITYGTSFLQPSEWSWRLPSLLQAVSSIFQITMTFFVPESPRWLVANNRDDEARQILVKYHAEGDENSELVRFEMAEMEYTLELDKKKRLSWMEWFRTPANRHRFFIILTLSFIIQWCGNAIISYYIGLMLESFGIEKNSTKLLINGGLTLWGLCWAITWSLLIEYVGRRKLFLTAMVGMFCAFLALTILSGINSSHNYEDNPLSIASVVMVFMHVAFYKMAGPTQDPYFMEISPYGLRAKTAVIKSFGDASANLFSGFVNPIGIDHIGWRYYIVWCCVLVSNFVIIYLFFPETKGLSLEEVTQMFDGGEVPEEALTQQAHEGDRPYDESRSTSMTNNSVKQTSTAKHPSISVAEMHDEA